jgi:hypothetical protein
VSEAVIGEAGSGSVDPEQGRRLAARWWKWAFSAPPDRSPVRDRTGEFAGWGQPWDVWFLAGTYGGHVVRRCRIPAGRPIFFPVLNTMSPALGFSARPWRLDVSGAEAVLNGIPLPMRELTSKRFWALRRPRIAWGLWCALDPLRPGQYVLSIKAACDEFWVDTTYHLEVVAA